MIHGTAYLTKTDILNVFFTETTTTLTHRPTEADATNRNPNPVATVTIPYIKATSETISRILQPYTIRLAHQPRTTLQDLLTKNKDRDEPNNRQGAVYNIKCFNCQASYNTNEPREMVMPTITCCTSSTDKPQQ